jgi:hypothetical protein
MALQATKVYKMGTLDPKTFYEYLHGRDNFRGQLQREAMELMEAVGAPFGLNEYDARTYLPKVIEHWNKTEHAGQFLFKAFLFGSTGQ